MTPNEYQKLALKTCNDGRLETWIGGVDARLLHAAIGICTEVGELQDALKKDFIYRKDYDETNIVEEFGDILWYVAVGLDGLGVTLEEAMEKNIAKLKARYGEKFTEEAALNRDLEKERKVLELDVKFERERAFITRLDVEFVDAFGDELFEQVFVRDEYANEFEKHLKDNGYKVVGFGPVLLEKPEHWR